MRDGGRPLARSLFRVGVGRMKVKLSGSFRRYFVALDGSKRLADRLGDQLPSLLQKYRFRSIDTASNEMRSVGWTLPDGRVPRSFEEHDPWFGRKLYLGLRIDVKRIPAGALKVRRAEAEAAERQEVGEKIPPARRREIHEQLQTDLLSRSLPSTSVCPVLWDTTEGQVLFGATAEAADAALRGLFRDTFEVSLQAATPATVPMRVGLSRAEQGQLEALLPVTFTGD